MTDQTKPKFNCRAPRTREDALKYIEKLCAFYDIQLQEDALLDVIHAQEQKHQEQLRSMWLQVVGAVLETTGKEFLTIDTKELLDRQPYQVVASDYAGKTRFRLVKEN